MNNRDIEHMWKVASNNPNHDTNWHDPVVIAFAVLVAAQDREAIMKSIEELNPVENNPLLQNKPASFWIENFRQIVYARGTA